MEDRRLPQILLVDDEPHQRVIYRAIFEHRGYRVLEAGDGEAAVRVAEDERPDLILMDVGLPWMDGWEVTRRLKSMPRTSAIPVMAISAQVGSEGELRAESAGCVAFLAKSLEPSAVADAVAAVIGAAR
jgi:CheY-like chemotaxis protein